VQGPWCLLAKEAAGPLCQAVQAVDAKGQPQVLLHLQEAPRPQTLVGVQQQQRMPLVEDPGPGQCVGRPGLGLWRAQALDQGRAAQAEARGCLGAGRGAGRLVQGLDPPGRPHPPP
jgi:hypothetical protein